MLVLGVPIEIAACGAALAGFIFGKSKVEVNMKLNVKTKLKTKMVLAVAWSLEGRRGEVRFLPLHTPVAQ